MEPIQFEAVVNQEQVNRSPDGLPLHEECVERAVRPTASEGDDLSWEDLDYTPVPLKSTRQVLIHMEQCGELQPMRHALDEE
jgi:hypothetical protein